MLQKEKPDVVFTCIPPGAHTTQVADAAASGAALFVAKPVAQDLETAQHARDAIDTAGVINQVGYMARYSDITAKAKELVGDQKLAMGFGRFLARMGANHPWWGKYDVSRGQMVEQTTHVFDLIRYFLGDVASVHASGIKGVSEGIADFEECTVCNMQFESGAVGNITSTCVARAHDSFATELVGDDIYLKLTHDLGLRGQIGGETIDYTGTEAGYFRQVEQFIKAVEANSLDQGLVLSSYADAVKTLANVSHSLRTVHWKQDKSNRLRNNRGKRNGRTGLQYTSSAFTHSETREVNVYLTLPKPPPNSLDSCMSSC